MSQTSNPFGFRAVGHLKGGTPRPLAFGVTNYGGQVGLNGISASNSNPIYLGAPVKLSAGYITQAVAADTTAPVGVFAGCQYNDASGTEHQGYWPGTSGATNIVAYVFVDDGLEFAVQLDGSVSSPITAIGAYTVLSTTNAGSGSSQNFQSTMMLSASGLTTTAAGTQYQVVRYQPTSDNAPTDAYPIVIARICAPMFGQSQILAT